MVNNVIIRLRLKGTKIEKETGHTATSPPCGKSIRTTKKGRVWGESPREGKKGVGATAPQPYGKEDLTPGQNQKIGKSSFYRRKSSILFSEHKRRSEKKLKGKPSS